MVGYTRATTGFGLSDILVIKFSPIGTVLWTQRFNAGDDARAVAIALDPFDNPIVSALFNKNITIGGKTYTASGTNDSLLMKLGALTGTPIWTKQFSGSYDEEGIVATDSAGNIYLTGYFRGSINFGGATLRVPFDTDLDVFIAKFDANGNHLWSKNFINDGNDRGYGIAADGSGVTFGGFFTNTINFGGGSLIASIGRTEAFVAKLDANGNHVWSKRFGGAADEGVYSVALDFAGNAVLTGFCYSPIDFGGGALSGGATDAFVAKLTGNNGGYLWARRFGSGQANDYGYSVAVDSNDAAVVTGVINGPTDFGGKVMDGSTSGTTFVARYNNLGLIDVKTLTGTGTTYAQSVAVAPDRSQRVTGYFTNTVSIPGQSVLSAGQADAFLWQP